MKRLAILILILFTSLYLGACGSQTTPPPTEMETPVASMTHPSQIKPSPSQCLSTATRRPSSTLTKTPNPPTATTTATASPTTLTCWKEGGHMEQGKLALEFSRQPLEYRVYLPPCYDELINTYYPVLYLIHGQSYTDDQWDRLGVDELMDRMIVSNEIPAFLIVMPRDQQWTSPEIDPFDRAVTEVLVPYIDEIYRTLTVRTSRAVGGLSRGAGWALHFGLAHHELFSILGLHSLAVFWGDVPYIRQWLAEIPAEEMPRIYIDLGDSDYTEIKESTIWFESVLTDYGIPHEYYLFHGQHVEEYWQSHIKQYLLWYAAGW